MDASNTAPAPWGLGKRIAFRFVFAYFILYLFPFPLDSIPGMGWFDELYRGLWESFVPWVGKHVLHLETDITVFPNGSGDTTFNYVQVLIYLVLAVVAAAVWSFVDAKRAEYTKAQEGLWVYIRYALAMVMFSYGISKVFKLQFPFPSPERLAQPYGESSPMGLLWTFMGYSGPYTRFTGAGEVLGGLLLFFRRTTSLGALVVVAIMSNVVMLNLSYDVPVKLYSSHLLLMAVILLIPDLRRLANVLVLNRPTEAVVLRTPFSKPWMEKGRLAAKAVFIVGALGMMTYSTLEGASKYGDDTPAHPLFGLYEVETFTRNGETILPTSGDAARWRRMTIFRQANRLTIRAGDDSPLRYRVKEDAEKKTLTLSPFTPGAKSEGPEIVLTYSREEPEHLVLTGPLGSDTINARLRKVDQSKYLLVNRGFHWVNEFPFNR